MQKTKAVNPAAPGQKHRGMAGNRKRQFAYLLMVLPGTLFLLAFNYLPMPGVVLAFKFYQMRVAPEGALIQNTFLNSMITSEWVGLNNFTYLLKAAPMLIRNTVGYNLIFMVVGFVTEFISAAMTATVAGVLCIVTGCVTQKKAISSINWNVLEANSSTTN